MILKFGMMHIAVGNLQRNLNLIGLGPLVVDNEFGLKTLKAVEDFQILSRITIDGVVGPQTQDAITKAVVKVAQMPRGKSETPWMSWMSLHEGEREIKGSDDNAFIMSLYKYGNYKAAHDEVPWCAVCANAALMINGYIGTGRADAISFAKCGEECELKFGAIVVIRHKDGSHHIAFFSKWIDEKKGLIELFGGNQSNALKKSVFNVSGNKNGKDQIIAVRWPLKKIDLTQALA